MDYLLSSFQGVSVIFAILALQTGGQAFWNPLAFAETFGLPMEPTPAGTLTSANKAMTGAAETNHNVALSFVTMMGMRQFAAGGTLLALAAQGKWVSVATVLSVYGVCAAGVDTYNLHRANKPSLARYHGIPGAIITGHAMAVLYWRNQL